MGGRMNRGRGFGRALSTSAWVGNLRPGRGAASHLPPRGPRSPGAKVRTSSPNE